MSTIKQSDCLEWTRKNYPSLTDQERDLLCWILLGSDDTCAVLLMEKLPTLVQSDDVMRARLSSIEKLFGRGMPLTVQDTLEASIAKRKPPVREGD